MRLSIGFQVYHGLKFIVKIARGVTTKTNLVNAIERISKIYPFLLADAILILSSNRKPLVQAAAEDTMR